MSDWCGISGSSAGDTIACPSRLAFPQARAEAGAAADRGNVIHEFLRTCTVNPEGRDAALAAVTDVTDRATCSGIDLTDILVGLTVIGCERAYALNVETQTCRFIGTNIGRDYNGALARQGQPLLGKYEIPFTIDVEAQIGDTPVELDYKTGQSIGPVYEHWQRRVCSIGLMLHYDAASAVSRVAYIRPDGKVFHDGADFSMLDIDDFCAILKRAIDNVWASRALLSKGQVPTVTADREKQCRYCPSFDFCPYWNNLVRGAGGLLKELPDVDTVAASEAGRIFDYVKDVIKVATEVEKKLKERVYREALPVNDTLEYRAEEKSGRSYFDDAAARGLLVQMMGKAGLPEDEINATLRGLTRQGANVTEIRKRKVKNG